MLALTGRDVQRRDAPVRAQVQRRVQDEAQLNEFVDKLRDAKRTPKNKQRFPMTSSQEYGWDIEDEVSAARGG